MSTQSIITTNNLSTDKALQQYIDKKSVDLLKFLRFEIGTCTNFDLLRDIMRLERLICRELCYIDENQERDIREAIIRKAINQINEL